ncbi:MAG TPA: type II toxin-antitoxin system prevent-host-death family antitoxin [Kofleriaceae bacterium]
MARILDMAQARAQLAELIERAASGEEIILGHAGKPRARLVPLGTQPRKPRIPGKGKGRFRVKEGFDEPLPERVLRLFEE